MTILKTAIFLLCAFAAACAFAGVTDKETKSIKSGQFWNDAAGQRINAHGGNVIFYNGVYYWYGEDKEKGLSEKTNADAGIHCYASNDLINWHDTGMMLSLIKGETLSDLAFDCNQDRPKVVYNEKTKTFVMFFKLYLREKGTDVGFIGVATSVSPTGPFNYSHKFLAGNSANGSGDFAMFKDEDGALYHLAVRKPDKAFVAGKMREDYLLPEGEYKICEGILNKTEAPAVFKKDGVYHMLASGSTGWKPNAARYFTAKSIYGPWENRGNPCEGVNPNNKLGSELTYGGQAASIISVQGKKDAFIAFFDINVPEHPYDNLYIWLPIEFKADGLMRITWRDEWDLSVFDK